MGERQRLGVQDALWLEMDRAHQPDGGRLLDLDRDADRLGSLPRRRAGAAVGPLPRVPQRRRCAPRTAPGTGRSSAGDPFETRLRARQCCPKPGGDAELQELIASRRTVPLDRGEPLWQVTCVDGFKGGSAVVFRSHHAIADGMRMVQIAMSLFDASPDGGAILAPAVQLHAATPRPPGQAVRQQLLDGASSLAKELAELATEMNSASARWSPIRSAWPASR